jgi:hypothetical protein
MNVMKMVLKMKNDKREEDEEMMKDDEHDGALLDPVNIQHLMVHFSLKRSNG